MKTLPIKAKGELPSTPTGAYPKYAKVNVAKERATAEKALKRLSLCALNGNPEACRAVVEVAAQANSDTRSIASGQPQHADQIARGRISWPLNVDAHPEMQKRDLRWLTALPLGETTGWKKVTKGKKSYSISTQASATVMGTLRLMDGCKGLDGTREGADRLFALIWARVKESHGGEPERDKRLRMIGLSNAKGALIGSNDEKHLIRDGIRKRLRAAFRAMFEIR